MFEQLEEIFQKWRDYDGILKSFITFATALGIVIFLIYLIRVILYAIKLLRLYVISQWCSPKGDFFKKYGRWAVVTGATDGIGRFVAEELVKRGLSIVIIGRNSEKLANVKRQLEELANDGEQVVTIKSDLSDPSPANFERIRSKLELDTRDIGILVNNAGVISESQLVYHKHDDNEQWKLANLNIMAPFKLVKMVLPGMVSRKRGLIVNVSSEIGHYPAPYLGLYGPSKTCLSAFTKALNWEYSSVPIDIVDWAPGGVRTKLLTQVVNDESKVAFLSVPADYYAKTAVNALSTRISAYAGTLLHEMLYLMGQFIQSLGLLKKFSQFGVHHFGKGDTSPYSK